MFTTSVFKICLINKNLLNFEFSHKLKSYHQCACSLSSFRHNAFNLIGPGVSLNKSAVLTLFNLNQRTKSAGFIYVNEYILQVHCKTWAILSKIYFSKCPLVLPILHKHPNHSITQHGVSQIFGISLSFQLLHRFALLFQSGSHCFHYGGLKKLRPSEKHKTHISDQSNVQNIQRQCVKV